PAATREARASPPRPQESVPTGQRPCASLPWTADLGRGQLSDWTLSLRLAESGRARGPQWGRVGPWVPGQEPAAPPPAGAPGPATAGGAGGRSLEPVPPAGRRRGGDSVPSPGARRPGWR